MRDSGPGDPRLDELFSAAYEELRRLASLVKSDDPRATLSPTTLVNEAFLKLAASPRFKVFSDLHFRRIVARAMRQVLVEAARRRNAAKRGRDVVFVTLDESMAEGVTSARDVLALDAALDTLERLNPRQAEMVVKLGRSLLRQQRSADAEREILAGYDIVSRQSSPSVSWLRAAREDLAALYTATGRPEQAAKYRTENQLK